MNCFSRGDKEITESGTLRQTDGDGGTRDSECKRKEEKQS